MPRLFVLLPLVVLWVCAVPAPEARAGAAQCGYTVVAEHPHDTQAFTQGLFMHQGKLYESVGRYGRSSLRQVELETGRVLKEWPLPPNSFGEGAAAADGEAVVLTWKAGKAFRVGLDSFALTGRHYYAGQGWGLAYDGRRFIQSTGDAELIFRNPVDFKVSGRVPVREGVKPVLLLNELEYMRGRVLANVWMSRKVAVIDPADGQVTGWLNFSPLVNSVAPKLAKDPDAVLNGLAWDPARQRLYATGKLWPVLFELEPAPCEAYRQTRQGVLP